MKKDETNSWGGRGLKPFVISTCNCLNAVSSRGVPRLIAGTWRVFQGRATCPVSCTFFLCSVIWHLWSGPVWPFIPWAVLGAVWTVLLEYRYFWVGDKGRERTSLCQVPSVSYLTQCPQTVTSFEMLAEPPGEVQTGKLCPQSLDWRPWKAVIEL